MAISQEQALNITIQQQKPLYNAEQEMKQLDSSLAVFQRTAARAGGGGGGRRQREPASGMIFDPKTGQYRKIYGSTAKERQENMAAEDLFNARQALSQDKKAQELFKDYDSSSVEKQGEILNKFRKEILPTYVRQYGVNPQAFLASTLGDTMSEHAERQSAVQNEGLGSIAYDSFRMAANRFKDSIGDVIDWMNNDTQSQMNRAKARTEYERGVVEQNPFLENRERRMAEGAGVLDRMGLQEIAAMAGENADLAAMVIGGGIGGAAIRGAARLGRGALGLAGLADAATAASTAGQGMQWAERIGRMAGSGAALSGTVLTSSIDRIMADDTLTEAQKREAIERLSTGAVALGTATGAFVEPLFSPLAGMTSRAFARRGIHLPFANTGVTAKAVSEAKAAGRKLTADELAIAQAKDAANAANEGFISRYLTGGIPAAAVEGSALGTATTVGTNALYGYGTGKDVNLAENVPETIATAVATAPLFGLIMTPRRHALTERETQILADAKAAEDAKKTPAEKVNEKLTTEGITPAAEGTTTVLDENGKPLVKKPAKDTSVDIGDLPSFDEEGDSDGFKTAFHAFSSALTDGYMNAELTRGKMHSYYSNWLNKAVDKLGGFFDGKEFDRADSYLNNVRRIAGVLQKFVDYDPVRAKQQKLDTLLASYRTAVTNAEDALKSLRAAGGKGAKPVTPAKSVTPAKPASLDFGAMVKKVGGYDKKMRAKRLQALNRRTNLTPEEKLEFIALTRGTGNVNLKRKRNQYMKDLNMNATPPMTPEREDRLNELVGRLGEIMDDPKGAEGRELFALVNEKLRTGTLNATERQYYENLRDALSGKPKAAASAKEMPETETPTEETPTEETPTEETPTEETPTEETPTEETPTEETPKEETPNEETAEKPAEEASAETPEEPAEEASSVETPVATDEDTVKRIRQLFTKKGNLTDEERAEFVSLVEDYIKAKSKSALKKLPKGDAIAKLYNRLRKDRSKGPEAAPAERPTEGTAERPDEEPKTEEPSVDRSGEDIEASDTDTAVIGELLHRNGLTDDEAVRLRDALERKLDAYGDGSGEPLIDMPVQPGETPEQYKARMDGLADSYRNKLNELNERIEDNANGRDQNADRESSGGGEIAAVERPVEGTETAAAPERPAAGGDQSEAASPAAPTPAEGVSPEAPASGGGDEEARPVQPKRRRIRTNQEAALTPRSEGSPAEGTVGRGGSEPAAPVDAATGEGAGVSEQPTGEQLGSGGDIDAAGAGEGSETRTPVEEESASTPSEAAAPADLVGADGQLTEEAQAQSDTTAPAKRTAPVIEREAAPTREANETDEQYRTRLVQQQTNRIAQQLATRMGMSNEAAVDYANVLREAALTNAAVFADDPVTALRRIEVVNGDVVDIALSPDELSTILRQSLEQPFIGAVDSEGRPLNVYIPADVLLAYPEMRDILQQSENYLHGSVAGIQGAISVTFVGSGAGGSLHGHGLYLTLDQYIASHFRETALDSNLQTGRHMPFEIRDLNDPHQRRVWMSGALTRTIMRDFTTRREFLNKMYLVDSMGDFIPNRSYFTEEKRLNDFLPQIYQRIAKDRIQQIDKCRKAFDLSADDTNPLDISEQKGAASYLRRLLYSFDRLNAAEIYSELVTKAPGLPDSPFRTPRSSKAVFRKAADRLIARWDADWNAAQSEFQRFIADGDHLRPVAPKGQMQTIEAPSRHDLLKEFFSIYDQDNLDLVNRFFGTHLRLGDKSLAQKVLEELYYEKLLPSQLRGISPSKYLNAEMIIRNRSDYNHAKAHYDALITELKALYDIKRPTAAQQQRRSDINRELGSYDMLCVLVTQPFAEMDHSLEHRKIVQDLNSAVVPKGMNFHMMYALLGRWEDRHSADSALPRSYEVPINRADPDEAVVPYWQALDPEGGGRRRREHMLASKAMRDSGIDGMWYDSRNTTDSHYRGDEGISAVIWNDAAMRVIQDHLNQLRGRNVLGEFLPTKNWDLIAIFGKSNPSTMLHESAHQILAKRMELLADGGEKSRTLYMKTLGNLLDGVENAGKMDAETLYYEALRHASTVEDKKRVENAYKLHAYQRLQFEQAQKDMTTLRSWCGLPTEGELTHDQYIAFQEQVARGFERYVAEGKAPNATLKGIFQRFKDLLKGLYRSWRKYVGADLNDDVRQVYDRWFQIDDNNVELPKPPVAAPTTPEAAVQAKPKRGRGRPRKETAKEIVDKAFNGETATQGGETPVQDIGNVQQGADAPAEVQPAKKPVPKTYFQKDPKTGLPSKRVTTQQLDEEAAKLTYTQASNLLMKDIEPAEPFPSKQAGTLAAVTDALTKNVDKFNEAVQRGRMVMGELVGATPEETMELVQTAAAKYALIQQGYIPYKTQRRNMGRGRLNTELRDDQTIGEVAAVDAAVSDDAEMNEMLGFVMNSRATTISFNPTEKWRKIMEMLFDRIGVPKVAATIDGFDDPMKSILSFSPEERQGLKRIKNDSTLTESEKEAQMIAYAYAAKNTGKVKEGWKPSDVICMR